MYYHNNDLSNRQLQLLNVKTTFVEAGLLEAGALAGQAENNVALLTSQDRS